MFSPPCAKKNLPGTECILPGRLFPQKLLPDLRTFLHDADALLQHVHSDIRLLLRQDERRRDAEGVFAGAQEQETALKRQFNNAVTLVVGGSLRLFVFHDFHADHQPAAAHVADHGMSLHPPAESPHHVSTDNFCILDSFAFENLHGRESGFNADRIPAESRSMGTGHPVHDFRAREHYTERHAGSNAFGNGDDVRFNAGVLDGPPFAAASGATLNLVGDEQDAMLIADAAQFAHEFSWSRQVAAFALNGFNENGCAFFRRHDRLEDAVFDEAYALGYVLFRRHALRLAIDIWIWHVGHARNHGEEAAALLRFRCGE